MRLEFKYWVYEVGVYPAGEYTSIFTEDFYEQPKIRFVSENKVTAIMIESIEVSLSMNPVTQDLMKSYKVIQRSPMIARCRAGKIKGDLVDVVIHFGDGNTASGTIIDEEFDYIQHRIKFKVSTEGESLNTFVRSVIPGLIRLQGRYTEGVFIYDNLAVQPLVMIKNFLRDMLTNAGYTVDIKGVIKSRSWGGAFDEYIDLWGGSIGELRQAILSEIGSDLPFSTGEYVLKWDIEVEGQEQDKVHHARIIDIIKAFCVATNSLATVSGKTIRFDSFPRTRPALTQLINIPEDPIFLGAKMVEGHNINTLICNNFEFYRGTSKVMKNIAGRWNDRIAERTLPYRLKEYKVECLLPKMVYPGELLDINNVLYKIKDIEYNPLLITQGIYEAKATVTTGVREGRFLDIPYGRTNYTA